MGHMVVGAVDGVRKKGTLGEGRIIVVRVRGERVRKEDGVQGEIVRLSRRLRMSCIKGHVA